MVAAVLGIFAIPEMMALGVKGGSIAKVEGKAKAYDIGQVMQGIGDVFRHPWLTFRTSVIGAVIGAIPGLGGDAASWICYGHAVQSAKDPSQFGKGDVRGVIAPETANNSKEGGSLLLCKESSGLGSLGRETRGVCPLQALGSHRQRRS